MFILPETYSDINCSFPTKTYENNLRVDVFYPWNPMFLMRHNKGLALWHELELTYWLNYLSYFSWLFLVEVASSKP